MLPPQRILVPSSLPWLPPTLSPARHRIQLPAFGQFCELLSSNATRKLTIPCIETCEFVTDKLVGFWLLHCTLFLKPLFRRINTCNVLTYEQEHQRPNAHLCLFSNPAVAVFCNFIRQSETALSILDPKISMWCAKLWLHTTRFNKWRNFLRLCFRES